MLRHLFLLFATVLLFSCATSKSTSINSVTIEKVRIVSYGFGRSSNMNAGFNKAQLDATARIAKQVNGLYFEYHADGDSSRFMFRTVAELEGILPVERRSLPDDRYLVIVEYFTENLPDQVTSAIRFEKELYTDDLDTDLNEQFIQSIRTIGSTSGQPVDVNGWIYLTDLSVNDVTETGLKARVEYFILVE